jgi:hypothetical protein
MVLTDSPTQEQTVSNPQITRKNKNCVISIEQVCFRAHRPAVPACVDADLQVIAP